MEQTTKKTASKAVFITFALFFPLLLEFVFEQIPSIVSATDGLWFTARIVASIAGLFYLIWATIHD